MNEPDEIVVRGFEVGKTFVEISRARMAVFYSRVPKLGPEECWEWTGWRSTPNYGMFSVGQTEFLTHRLMFFIKNGMLPPHLKVCHRCDNPPCCNPDHLFLGTQNDNVQDMIKKGRMGACGLPPELIKRGSACTTARFNEEQVMEMRRLYADGMTQKELAIRYDVGSAWMCRLVHRKIWAHV